MPYSDYPIIELPRKRMFPDVIPVGEGEQLIRDGLVSAPTIRRNPMYAPENAAAPMADPRQQFAQNVEASVPQINARTQMAPVDLALEDDGSYALPEATPDRTGIEKRFPSMRAAEGYAEQQDLIRPGPQSRRALQMAESGPPVAKKGWGGRAMAALKGLAYAGSLGGAIRGAFQPQVIADYEYHNRDLPAAQHQAQIEQANQNRQLQAGDRVAAMTGENPWTDEPTEPARHRMWQEQESAVQHRQTNEDRDARLKQEAQAKREMSAKNHVQAARLYRKPVDYRAVKDTSLEWLAGAVPPKDKLEPGAMNENQKRSLDLREREFKYKQIRDEEKDAAGGFTLVQLKQIASQFEHKKTEAHTFYNTKVAPEERMLGNLQNWLAKGEIIPLSKSATNPSGIKVTPEMVSDQEEKVAQLRQTSDTMLNEARALGEQHPHWTENSAGGDIDYKAMRSAAPARRGGGGQPRVGHKVGDTVTVNGKTVKIGKIYPDGSFDPE